MYKIHCDTVIYCKSMQLCTMLHYVYRYTFVCIINKVALLVLYYSYFFKNIFI
jgi:hypothetical protein